MNRIWRTLCVLWWEKKSDCVVFYANKEISMEWNNRHGVDVAEVRFERESERIDIRIINTLMGQEYKWLSIALYSPWWLCITGSLICLFLELFSIYWYHLLLHSENISSWKDVIIDNIWDSFHFLSDHSLEWIVDYCRW